MGRPSDSAKRGIVAVVNGAASGARTAREGLDFVVDELHGRGTRASGVVTESLGDLRDVLETADGRRVVLFGGDGTLHAAVNSGVELPELAIVPAGRANNVARALGVPEDWHEAMRVAVEAPARPVDVLRVDTGDRSLYAIESVSAGLQAEARSHYTGENSGDLGAGARAFAGALRRYQPYRVEIRGDRGWSYTGDAAQVFLSNLPYFGFGFHVDPLARPADGLLEAIVVQADSRVDVARLMLSLYRGTHIRNSHVRVERTGEAVLTGPLPLAGDATPLGTGSATVSVEQGLLAVAAP
jgi:diacylglycerol kinase (ATP)